MSEPVFPGGIDLVPGPQGPPIPTNGLRLVTIGGALYATTDGITFTAVSAGGLPSGTALPVQAANLTDASVTVNPGTDAASQYTLPAATLTANRTLTLGTTGSPATNLVVQVIRRDLTAHTYAIINGGGGGGTMFTFASAPATAQGATFYYDGTNWNFLNFWFVAA